MGLDRRRLILTPASFTSLYLAELAGLLSSPVSAIVAAFIVPAVLPLAFLPHPALAIPSFLLCFAAAILVGSALSTLLSTGPRSAGIAAPFRIAFAAVMIGLVLANFDFQWKDGRVSLFVFMQRSLLDDGAGSGLLPLLRPWSPSAWIAARGLSGWAGLLLSAALAVAAAAFLALAMRTALAAAAAGPRESSLSARRRSGPVPRGTPGAVLLAHELRRLSSRGPTRFGAAAAVGVAAWTLLARDVSASMPMFGVVIALAALFSFASNIFGPDGPALRRYLMLSPDWGAVFASRNGAYGVTAAAFLLPLAAAAAIRISPGAAACVLLTGLLVAMIHCLWGNVSSMLLPSAEAGPRARAPAFANQVALLAAWAIPFALHRSLRFGTPAYALAAGGCLLGAAILYAVMLARVRGHFAEDAEAVLARM